jgi:xanthine dehydrogenase accessory factor
LENSNVEPITYNDIHQTRIILRGGGDLASGIAHRLFNCGFKVCLVETATPLAVRRMVSFCEAVYDGEKEVEGVTAVRIDDPEQIYSVWESSRIPLIVDPHNDTRHVLKPHVVIDAILAKRNLGTRIDDAPLVVGLGPGFRAPEDVHVVIETNRGHNIGRLIFQGEAESNTGIPGMINGYTTERVFRAPCDGIFKLDKNIGDMVSNGDQVARVEAVPITSKISGVVRGILRDGTRVTKGLKTGDVDPRGDISYCPKISDKARTLGGAVIEAILSGLPGRLGS